MRSAERTLLWDRSKARELLVPVTAKLSRQFYERLGDEITNELVDWLNQVDTSYRLELRELNESNFGRFDANVERRFAESDAKVERRFAEFERRFADFEVKVDRRFADVEVRMEQRFAELELKIEKIRSEMAAFKAELIKWMFLFWLGTVATTLAISQAVR